MTSHEQLERANTCKCGELVLLTRDKVTGEWLCMGSLVTDTHYHSRYTCSVKGGEWTPDSSAVKAKTVRAGDGS